MKFVTAAVLMSLLWILFDQLNRLRTANDGCCRDNSCGKRQWDSMLWKVALILAIIMTLFMVYKIYQLLMSNETTAKMFRRNPAKSVAVEAREMVFG